MMIAITLLSKLEFCIIDNETVDYFQKGFANIKNI
jgi:hypothetical protein